MIKFIVIAITEGDGELYTGRRIWSHEFCSKSAAEAVVKFLAIYGATVDVKMFADEAPPAELGRNYPGGNFG